MTDWPLITIVTPSMNQGKYLEATIQSVLSQNYPNLEFFLIDGGSNDNSVEIIRRYVDQITWWVSEPDVGQTDALIKGFSRAKGDLMNWLNSDDLLRPGALHAVAEVYAKGAYDMIAGRDRQFRTIPDEPVSFFQPSGYSYPECLRPWDGVFRHHQPCTFFSRRIYERVGGLDVKLHYVMDFDIYCRMLADPDCSVFYIDQELSAFRLHEEAKTTRAKEGFTSETRDVIKKHWPKNWGRLERKALDGWSARCSMFNFSEAFYKCEWKQASKSLGKAFSYSPKSAIKIGAQQMFAKFIKF